jgi:hypothetical protein
MATQRSRPPSGTEMASNEPRPDDERGRVLPFVRPGALQKPRATRPQPWPRAPVEDVGKYARGDGSEQSYRQRMINNVLAVIACVVLVSIGVWLAENIAEMRKNQDCVLSGRRNCTPVGIPSAGPTINH